jgi:hypothetical protein
MPLFAAAFVKLLLYPGVAAVGAWRWGAALRFRWLRAILGGLARFALGLLVGVPAGLLLHDPLRNDGGGGATFYVVFFTLRFLLWLLVLRVAFLKAPWREVAALAAAGTLLNAALDFALPDSLYEMFRVNFC